MSDVLRILVNVTNNCVAIFGTAKRKIKIVRINPQSTFFENNAVGVGKGFTKTFQKFSKINPWQASIVSVFQLSPHAIVFLYCIFSTRHVADYSSLAGFVKSEQQNIILRGKYG